MKTPKAMPMVVPVERCFFGVDEEVVVDVDLEDEEGVASTVCNWRIVLLVDVIVASIGIGGGKVGGIVSSVSVSDGFALPAAGEMLNRLLE